MTIIRTGIFMIILLSASHHHCRGERLVANGSFDAPGDPLAGWVVDYAWANNEHYLTNRDRVTVLDQADGRFSVCRLSGESKIETFPIPFEAGYRYHAALTFKGPDYRIFFVGYTWKPGVKPYDDPSIASLRQIYKSRAETGSAEQWRTITLELPGKQMTGGMKAFLKQIKYVTLFLYVTGGGWVDEVVVTRRVDPSVVF